MDLKQMAVSLGLPESATEAEINTAIAKGRKAQSNLQALQEENERREKAALAANIKAALDKAEKEKRITADIRGDWETILNTNYESGIKALGSLPAVEKVDITPGSKTTDSKTTYKGKTFDELQEADPDALAELEKNDPKAFEELFNASQKGK
ncbi:MAG: hypothetical protein LBL33_08815 [Tannerella sp.]|jgi:hypothetical protein|nr:hypothetical protein [Tannerella sp.]